MPGLEDSREWKLPPGTRVGASGLESSRASVLLAAAWPPGVGWVRYRGRALPAAVIRRSARAHVVVAVLAAALGIGSALMLLGLNAVPDAGDGLDAYKRTLSTVTVWSIPVAVLFGHLGAWVLRMARRVDPATPVAAPVSTMRSVHLAADLGEDGIRFPHALPVSLVASLGGMFALSLVPTNLRGEDGPLFVAATGFLVLIPLTVALAWWPLLRRALSGGVPLGRIRVIGRMYIAMGVLSAILSGTAFVALTWEDGGYFPATLGVILAGGMLAWRGVLLVRLARAVPGALPRPVDCDATGSPEHRPG